MLKTVIRTPFPSAAQVAEKLGLSRSDVERLDRMMDTILGNNGNGGDRRRVRPAVQAKKKSVARKRR